MWVFEGKTARFHITDQEVPFIWRGKMPLIRRHASQRVHVMPSGENSNKPTRKRRPQSAKKSPAGYSSHHEGRRMPQHPNSSSSNHGALGGSNQMTRSTASLGGGGGDDSGWMSSDGGGGVHAEAAATAAAATTARAGSGEHGGGGYSSTSAEPWRDGHIASGAALEAARTSTNRHARASAMRDPQSEKLDGVRRVVPHNAVPAAGPREIYVTVHVAVEDASTGYCIEDAEVAVFSRGNVQLGSAFSSDAGEAIFGLVFLGAEHIVFSVARAGYVLQRKAVNISDNHDQTSLRVTVRLVPVEISAWLRARVVAAGQPGLPGRLLRNVRLEVFRTVDSKQLGTQHSATGEASCQLHLPGPETLTVTASKEGFISGAKSVRVTADDHGCHVPCEIELQPSGITTQIKVTLRAASEMPSNGSTQFGRGAHAGRAGGSGHGVAGNALNAALEQQAFRDTRVTVRRTDGKLVALMTADDQGVATCAAYLLEPCFCEVHVEGVDGFADACLPFEVARHHDGQQVALAMALRPTQAEVQLVLSASSRAEQKSLSGCLVEVLEVPRPQEGGHGGMGPSYLEHDDGDRRPATAADLSLASIGGAADTTRGGGGGGGMSLGRQHLAEESFRLASMVPSAELARDCDVVATGYTSMGGAMQMHLHLALNGRYLMRVSKAGYEPVVQDLPIAWHDSARVVEVAVVLGGAAREKRQLLVAVGHETSTIGVILVAEDTTLSQVRDMLRTEQLDGTPDAFYFMHQGQKCGVATEAHLRAFDCFPTLVLQPRTAVHPYLVSATPAEVQIGWEPSRGASEYMVDVYHESTKETYVGTFERWHQPERAGRRQECMFKFRGFQGMPLAPNQQFNFVVRPVLPGHSTKDDVVLTVRTREKAMLATLREDAIEVIQPVLFKNKTAAILAKSYPVLECVAEVMALNTYLHVRVRGHANGGTGSKHQAAGEARLSLQRAEAVLRYLVMLGVPKRRLKCEGAGSKEMLFPPNSSHAHMNRRIEFQIVRDQALVHSFHTSD